jgi:hypothetical protein
LSIATRYGASRINSAIHNLATYHPLPFVMVPFVITLPGKILNQGAFLQISLSPPGTPNENHQLLFDKTSYLGDIVGSLPQNPSDNPLDWKPC